MYQHFFKRLLDILISSTAILCLSPLLVIVSVLLCFANEGAGVFFFQPRPGYKGRSFKVIKFKTMNDKKGKDGNLLPDLQRITRLGQFLRDTSIDELPQLFNVLKGDMSIIGPRPLLVQYLPLYTTEQMRRHDVRPGITGWAQCHGRNNLSWTEKFKLDVWYVDHVSFLTDVRVIWYTIITVLSRKGINTEDKNATETMESFNGHN